MLNERGLLRNQGCDSGFGNATAKRLDSLGFHVFASCIFPEGPGADDLRKSCSKRLRILELDVSRDDSVREAVQFVEDNLGKSELWAIVNNAGVVRGISTEVTPMKEFHTSMEINGFGTVRVAKAFLPLLKKSKGRVVNVVSIAGLSGFPQAAAYTMSKFASYGFSECLRREINVWGVRVITIEPEGFQTPMVSNENLSPLFDGGVDKNIETIYGKNYLKHLRNFVKNVKSSASPKIFKVIDDIEKAITLETPDISYSPSRNFLCEEAFKLSLMLPKVLQDAMFVFLQYLVGWPRPDSQQ